MTPTRDEIWTVVRDIVAEMVSVNGIDPEEIQPSSQLAADFGLSSVDTIHLMISLEERLGDHLDLEKLVMKDGVYITELAVGDLHDFLCRQLGIAA
jgi:acyl carrier protein